jgi:hypothetical protein
LGSWNKLSGNYLLASCAALFSAASPCLANDFDSYQFLEGHIPGSPLYHVSLHIHLKEPYNGGPRDWFIGGLASFRRNQIRGPIVVESLKTDRPAKVLGFEETALGDRKEIDHSLAVSIIDSAIYLKDWLLKQEFAYSGIPISGIGLTSNSIVRAILVKNNAYHLWSGVHYNHIAPGTGQNDPGIPGYDEAPLKFPMIGEVLFWGLVILGLGSIGKTVAIIRAKRIRKPLLESKTQVKELV